MRRILYASLALVLLAGAVKAWAAVYTVYDLGSSGESQDDFRHYVQVKNNDQAATSLVNGDVVIWDIRNATNASLDRFSVTTTTVASHPSIAGVMTQATAVGRYGYMQVYGRHTAIRTTGPIEPDSQQLETSTTRGRAQGNAGASAGPLGTAQARVGSGSSTVDGFIHTQ